MPLHLYPPPSHGNLHRNDAQEDRPRRSAKRPGTGTYDTRGAVAETVDGRNIEVLELRATIIRLREQMDKIHSSYEERVQQLESTHRGQQRELEATIRHLRDRLQTLTDMTIDIGDCE